MSAQMITVIEEVTSFPAGWVHRCVLWFVTWTPHSFLSKCKPCCNLSHFCLPEVSVFIAQGMLPSTKQVRSIITTQTALARAISWPKHKDVSLVYNYFSPLALKPPRPPGGQQFPAEGKLLEARQSQKRVNCAHHCLLMGMEKTCLMAMESYKDRVKP